MTTTHGFEIQEERVVPELNMTATLYRHKQTGARLLSISNQDENKVFGITFRTPATDSTGLPHIMEHSVLCGSEKYPVREPFIELAKGSLNTFLNAMTFADKTCYPIASQNLHDFYNLVDVYLDAVFHPLLSEYTLLQEGWHYELETLDGPLSYKGVVFNEMKGAYSSPDERLSEVTRKSLFPDHVYYLDSGGDPLVMPDLTYQQFKEYHSTYYHPTNAFIYFYGDDDPIERLRRLDACLRDFQEMSLDSAISLCPPFSAPQKFAYEYDSSDEGEQAKSQLVVAWKMDEPVDIERALANDILEEILIGSPASPLRKALVDSGLGEDLAGGGLDTHLRQPIFSTGLKGINDSSADLVEALVLDTLQKLSQQGIDQGTLAASLNTVEFHLRENNTGSFPRGLYLMLRCLTNWIYDRDPIAPLSFEPPLDAIKKHLENSERYFENLIAEHFLKNSHRATVLLKPDAEFGKKLEEAEQARLENERDQMGTGHLQKVIEITRELHRRQDTPDSFEALATIPRLHLDDLERKNKLIPLEKSDLQSAPFYYHDLFTNKIIYLDLGFNLHALPAEYIPYVNLFGKAILGTGAGADDFVRLTQRIGRETGGIHMATLATARRNQPKDAPAACWLFLRSKATVEKGEELVLLLKDILTSAHLDNRDRFRQIAFEEKADMEARLVPAGNRYVNLRLRSRFDEAGWAAEKMDGISYLFTLREIVNQVEEDWPGVLNKLETIRASLITRNTMVFNLTLDRENASVIKPNLLDLVNLLPNTPFVQQNWDWKVNNIGSEGLAIPSQVNYVGMGANLYELGYQLSGSALVINNFLNATWLWEKVRVQGGAYGGSCTFDPRSGVFTFLSYRDPNIVPTLENFKGASEFLTAVDDTRLDQSELEKSIIGTIGDLDFYQLPDAKGYISLVRDLAGDTNEYRQQLREQILATKRLDFHLFGQILRQFNHRAEVVVIGSQNALEKANASGFNNGHQLSIAKVL